MLSKFCDVVVIGNVFSNFLFGLGLVTSGFTPWVYSTLVICDNSQSCKEAVVNELVFFASMLIAYYSYSKFAVGYLSIRVVLFWTVALIFSVTASYFVCKLRYNKTFKIVAVSVSLFLAAVSIVFIEGIEIYALLIEFILLVLLGVRIFKIKK